MGVVVESFAEARADGRPVHLAIGMFDGVHRGHQAVIDEALEAASRSSGIATALTFWPHPSSLFRPKDPTLLIQSREVRAERLLASGLNQIIEIEFNRAFAAIEAEAFVPYLKEQLPELASIAVGQNFRFGKARRGNGTVLRETAEPLAIATTVVQGLLYGKETVSSTRIRLALAGGQIDEARAMLGYPYFSRSTVQAGKRLGRSIGYPTLNLPWSPQLRPRLGVYAVTLSENGGPALPAVANYGLRPTVESSREPLLEAHLLREDGTAWDAGTTLQANWLAFLRPEQKFASLDALKAQIAQDRETAQQYFAQANDFTP